MSKLHVDIIRRLPGFTLEAAFDADESCLALLGASGSGKSQTLRCIAGIDKPSEGVITLNGRTLFDSAAKIDLPPQKRNVGYMFQRYALFDHMTVWQNVAAGLRHLNRTDRDKRVQEQLRTFQLEALAQRYPSELSGGQQQRVALARVMAYEPEVLMLDEPFSALDSYLRWQLEPQMLAFLRDYHGVPLYVSHNRDEAYRLCSRIAVLEAGRIVALGDKKAVFADPGTVAAAAITGCKNLSPARRLDEHTLLAEDWELPLVLESTIPQDTAALGLRAHYMAAADAPGKNVVEILEPEISEAPFSVTVMFRAGQGRIRWEIDRTAWEQYARDGLPRYLRIDPRGVMCLKGSDEA